MLHILDSTDPEQIRAVARRITIAETLFIVSSKSGGTLEPNILKQYFFDLVSREVGPVEAGKRFVVVTDPGSPLEKMAEREGFAARYQGDPAIGGRYSVLSAFGAVPAAAMGIDVERLFATTRLMVRRCGADVPPEANPGVLLGVILGVACRRGRDKLTILTGPGLESFGAWAEQLIAESTGKNGHGLIPVDGEPIGAPAFYGDDRLFVHLTLGDRPDPAAASIAALEAAGQPIIRINLADAYHLGQEFFRWEIAVAVAGSILAIDPFDQPDVEASKIATRKLTDAYEQTGTLPDETPFWEDGGIRLFADPANAKALRDAATAPTLAALLQAHLERTRPGDYAGLLAYIPRNAATIDILRQARRLIRDRLRVATCVGFGPRFLHSTGQIYKGGPNTGVFLQITCDAAEDLAVPGRKYTFGIVKAAQARGDFDVLAARGRRVLRVHLGTDLDGGLERLSATLDAALTRSD
jgi:transaldolase/glucose-6-phosphate isomerase